MSPVDTIRTNAPWRLVSYFCAMQIQSVARYVKIVRFTNDINSSLTRNSYEARLKRIPDVSEAVSGHDSASWCCEIWTSTGIFCSVGKKPHQVQTCSLIDMFKPICPKVDTSEILSSQLLKTVSMAPRSISETNQECKTVARGCLPIVTHVLMMGWAARAIRPSDIKYVRRKICGDAMV